MLQNLAKHGRGENGLFEISTHYSPFLEVAPIDYRKKPAKSLKEVIIKILAVNDIKYDAGEVARAIEKYKDMEKILDEFHYEYDSEKVKFSELEAKVPTLDLRKIIDNLMHPDKKSSIKDKVENRLVAFEHSLFFDKDMNLNKIIQSTSAQDLANFLIMYYIDTSGGALSMDEHFTMNRKCENEVIKFLPRASLRVFVRNYFDKENLKIVSEMVEETKQNFIEMIQESTWLHEETKKNAILKVEKMRKMIGYPEEFEKAGALDKTFETLNVFPTDSHYTIMNKIKRFVTEQTMEYVALETPLDPKEDVMEVNAFYVNDENYLNILVPFLDDPLFDSTYPTYAKLAGTGATLGHETGHGFDPWGITRDENGEKRDWWTPEDSEEYDRRVECMVEQYNEYDDPDFGKNLNGSYTKLEMVADGFGAETAWRAFKKLDLSREPEIIGFDEYSMEKLFFRIFALDYCTSRDTSTLEEVLERFHPTDSFRVNGVFSNMKAFAKTFNCPVGSPMNPEKKCELF
ncbi:hypothetical protein CAEBREN_26097 [Caenorhabditis brenneri]|uniref:Peptidase M13 C-terminal domain-containing protein n=1 Tax=Caenorhabditis brenneri TaxID=135651 RepID=G0NQK0_CAEBE|nr:hypothetical protein CAEBREN_26097 [Caenorhabditis brenneri]